MPSSSLSTEGAAEPNTTGAPYASGSEPARSTAPHTKWKSDFSLGSLALIDQIVVSGTNFATTLLLSNLCSQPEMGLFGLAWTLFGFQRTAQERMLSAPYMVFAHRADQETKSWLGSSLFHQRIFGLACTLMAWILAAFFYYIGRPVGMGPVMLSLGLVSSFLLLRDHVRAICSAHFRYDVSLLLDISVSVVQTGGIILLYWFDVLSIWTAMLVLGFACGIPTVAWLLFKPQPYRMDRSRVSKDWRTSWDYSRWLVAARTIGISGFYLIPWIVAYQMDEGAVGTFTVCSNLVGLSMMFIMGINNFFTPRTIKAFQTGGKNALVRSLVENIVVFGTFLGAVTVAMYFAGDWLLQFYGEVYVGFGSVVFYLSISMLTVCISVVWGNGLAALGKPRGYFWGELAYFVVSIGLAFALIPIWQLEGAALALVGGGCAVSLVTGVVLARLIHDLDSSECSGSEVEP